MDAFAEVLGDRQAVEAFEGRVDEDVAQVGVHDGEADRRLGDQARRERQVALDAPYGGLVGGDPEGVAPALPVLQPHVAELGVQDAAVPVPYGERPVPGSGAVHHLVEEGDDQVQVLLVDQEPRRVPAEHLLGV